MRRYFLYDGRYRTNEDRATLYEVCSTLKEAQKVSKDYGDDTVIVEYDIINSVATRKKIVN
tara:strand:- start:3584 stop:3766 length:183 start_codon:yes stop_codon:yes gene_type:complete